ncbi:hypothetical protein ATK36_1297 [Amycolatopsis sulphurea]|uniref:Uncharacterized protein n=1 Tax=Amycolatopsis sulphurea TaxID=76022 RepID=A0A2A9F689_9PSEU|nr:hypothetical protein [Amycolatopsis sulphurea]PFG46326.1 hypothetical protein ATK36_1297 [Amycolatopsis sulphurea]
MNAGFLDATRAEVEYRAAELQRAAGRSRHRPNRMLHWFRAHRSTPASPAPSVSSASSVPVPPQQRRAPAADSADARDRV